MGEESRWLRQTTILILLTTASVLVLIATSLSFLISKRIRDGVMIIKNGAEMVGSGDFTSRIEVRSRDELGILAVDLNKMTEDLQEGRDRLRKSEEKYRFLVENIPHGIFYKDKDSVYIACNKALADDLGISPADVAGKTDFDFFPPELAKKYKGDDRKVMEQGIVMEFDESYQKNGLERTVHTVKAPIRDDAGNVVGILGVFWDITELKRAEEERERLIGELRAALAKVTTLSGMLPICASCKRIRDDKGYWTQIESYIRGHSEAEFSHGLCPDCARKLYPEYADQILEEEEPREEPP